MNLVFKNEGFYGIVGKVGSGKSSLFSAILSEIPYCQGSLEINATVTNVEQEPVIFSTTIKENILFGLPFHSSKYKNVIRCCCLEEDMNEMIDQDGTDVGERGLALSGGQKIRIALARALYSESDVLLLDDPFSAVDAKVGMRMYDQLVKNVIGTRIVILITHQIQYLRSCENLIMIEKGKAKLQENEIKK